MAADLEEGSGGYSFDFGIKIAQGVGKKLDKLTKSVSSFIVENTKLPKTYKSQNKIASELIKSNEKLIDKYSDLNKMIPESGKKMGGLMPKLNLTSIFKDIKEIGDNLKIHIQTPFGVIESRFNKTVGLLLTVDKIQKSLRKGVSDVLKIGTGMEEMLSQYRLQMGGYANTLNAMNFAQDKLLSGATGYKPEDIMAGIAELNTIGIDAKKNFDLVNNFANVAGKSFAEASSALVSASSGNLDSLRQMGLLSTAQVKSAEVAFSGNAQAMKGFVLQALQNSKIIQDGYSKTLETIPTKIRRMQEFGKLFAQKIFGDPKDPNSFGVRVKTILDSINKFLYENKARIEAIGSGIGHVLGWIATNVGHFVNWVLKGITQILDSVSKYVGSFKDTVMRILLFLELAKGFFIDLFRKYEGAIMFAVKALLVLRAVSLAYGAVLWVVNSAVAAYVLLETTILRAAAATGQLVGLTMKYAGVIGSALTPAVHGLKAAYYALDSAILSARISMLKFSAAAAMGQVIAGINMLVNGLRLAQGAMLLFNLIANANPIGVIVLAIITVVALSLVLWKYWQNIVAFMQNIGDIFLLIIGIFNPFVGLVLLFIKYWYEFKAILINIWSIIENVAVILFYKLFDLVKYLGKLFYDSAMIIWGIISYVWNGMATLFTSVITYIGEQLSSFGSFIYAVFSPIIDFIAWIFKPIIDTMIFVYKNAHKLFEPITQFFSSLYANTLKPLFDYVLGFFKGIANFVGSILRFFNKGLKKAADTTAKIRESVSEGKSKGKKGVDIEDVKPPKIEPKKELKAKDDFETPSFEKVDASKLNTPSFQPAKFSPPQIRDGGKLTSNGGGGTTNNTNNYTNNITIQVQGSKDMDATALAKEVQKIIEENQRKANLKNGVLK